jgi:hypothetical protein
MRKTLAVWILLGLAGCAEISFRPVDLNSPCQTRPGSYECQIEMYQKVP